MRGACQQGYRTFIECSPHPALIAGIEDTFNDCTDGNAEPIVVPTLGRDEGGIRRFLTSAAQAFVSGVGVDWRAVLPGAEFVELPTYAFERRRFWLSGDGAAIDAAGLGLGASEHALLGAVVELPESGGVVLTGRLSASVAGLAGRSRGRWRGGVPGCGIRRVGDPRRRRGRLRVRRRADVAGAVDAAGLGFGRACRWWSGSAEESGQRSVTVFSRADANADSAWTCHASGQLSPERLSRARICHCGRRRARLRST